MQGKFNHPTVSTPMIMKKFAPSRVNERDTLISYVASALKPGLTVMDIQAAGGFLSDEIFEQLKGDVTIVCVEPNLELRSRLNSIYKIVNNPVENFYSISDESIDIAMGLIGLHHSNSHESTIKEIFRTLRFGGELAICDVYKDSLLAEWLNTYVNKNCVNGHQGNFPASGDISLLCSQAGLINVVEEPRNVPWIFSKRSDISEFFKGLFGLEVDVDEIDDVLDDFFTIRDEGEFLSVDWELMYCHAVKPKF